jgi:hypothetical protein
VKMNLTVLLGGVAALSTLTGSFGLAADLPVKAAAPAIVEENYIIESNNQISVDFVAPHLDYAEYGDGRLGTQTGILDTEKGWVPGVGGKLSVMNNWIFQNFYFAAEGSYAKGKTDYVGSVIGGVFGSVVTKDPAVFKDADFRLGKGFQLSPNAMFTPYFEYGWHQWVRTVNAGETYTNQYAGVGGLLQISPGPKWVFSANGFVGSTIDPHIFIAANPGSNLAIHTSLGTSVTYKVGLAADYAITRNLHVNAGVDFAHFNYGASPSVADPFAGFIWEPMSKSFVTTAKVGLGYAWGGPVVAKY